MDAPAELMQRAPWIWRFARFLVPGMMRRRVDGYRLNLFELVSEPTSR